MKIFNLLFVTTATFSTFTALADPLKIDVLNVGPGNCIVVSCPNNVGRHRAVVLDCGTSRLDGPDGNVRDVASAKVKALIEDRETDLIITHPDRDHANILGSVFDNSEEYALQNVFLGGKVMDYARVDGLLSKLQMYAQGAIYGSEEREEDEDSIYRSIQAINPLVTGDEVDELECGGAKFNFLYMNPDQAKPNERSLITVLEYKNYKIMFPGDGMIQSLQGAMAAAPDKMRNIDVLIAPHHGAHEPNALAVAASQVLAQHMRPRTLIYSAGDINGHPRQENFELYAPFLVGAPQHVMGTSYGAQFLYEAQTIRKAAFSTRENKDITITVDGQLRGASLSFACTGEDWCEDELTWHAGSNSIR